MFFHTIGDVMPLTASAPLQEILIKRFKNVIAQNLAVQTGQWLSFLCCYVVRDGENNLPSTPFKICTEFNKKCACTNETSARNLCNERLGVFY